MSSTTYRQLVLRLPDGLKETMRERVAADVSLDGVDFTPERKGSRRYGKIAGTKDELSIHMVCRSIMRMLFYEKRSLRKELQEAQGGLYGEGT